MRYGKGCRERLDVKLSDKLTISLHLSNAFNTQQDQENELKGHAKKEKSRENEKIRKVLVMWSGRKKGFS